MRKSIMLLLAVCALSFSAELLFNGDFAVKGKTDDKADCWDGGYTRMQDGDAFIVSCQKGEKNPYCEVNSYPFDVQAGTNFTISGKHTGAVAYLIISFDIAGENSTNIMEGIGETAEWTDFKFSKTVPAKAVQCRVILRTFVAAAPALFSDIHFDGETAEADNPIEGAIDMVSNGSFERTYGIEDKAALWGGSYVRSSEMAREGKFSAKCLGTKTYCEVRSLLFNVKAGTPFVLTGFYNGSQPTIYADFTFADGKSQAIYASKSLSIGRWTKFVLTGTVPENAVKCRVLLRGWSEKTPVYFDSVHFYGISAVEPIHAVTEAAGIQIEVPADATPTILTARKELENYLPKAVKTIDIGGRRLARIVLSIDKALDNDEAWTITEKDGVLSLSGGDQRGTLYAAYHFLEDCLGIHWWTPWEESVPSARDWKFDRLSLSGKPTFIYRDLYRSRGDFKGDLALVAVRTRMNRAGDITVPAEYGGSRTFGPPYFVHTFNRYVSNSFLKTHPDYLALVDGKREGGQYSGQLCMTNQELRDYLVNQMKRYIASSWSDAEADGLPRPLYFDLSQNDGNRFCECERCQKMVAETSITDVLMDFVNYVAEKVGEQYPEVLVTTLAYGKTVFAPKKIMPRDNVVIRLCNPNLASSSIYAPRFDEYRDTTEQWAKVAKHLMCWEYSLAHWPFPDDMGAQRMCQFYHKNNFDALFIEMSGEDFLLDCYDMKAWLYAKMMENPYADFETTRQIFLEGYYGAAAPHVDEWRKLVEKAEARNTKKLNRHRPIGFDFYTVDELVHAHKLFDAAEKAIAGDKTLETRLMRVRAPFNLLTGHRIARYLADWKEKGGTEKDFPVDREKQAANMRRLWLTDMERMKDDKISDVQKVMEGQISIMQNLGTEQHDVPEPPEFKGHTVQHFCPSTLTLHMNPNMSLIKDADAREGCAYQILCTPRDNYFDMPFQGGCYDTAAAKVTLEKKWDTLPKERGFQWLNMGKDRLHMKYYVYLTGSWELQATMGQYLEFGAKDLDVWVRVKFEGPKFYPQDVGKTNRIVVDSISFVEL